MNNSLYKKAYRLFAGGQSFAPNYNNCAQVVRDGRVSYQCRRKRGYGKHKSFCKQHAKMRGEE